MAEQYEAGSVVVRVIPKLDEGAWGEVRAKMENQAVSPGGGSSGGGQTPIVPQRTPNAAQQSRAQGTGPGAPPAGFGGPQGGAVLPNDIFATDTRLASAKWVGHKRTIKEIDAQRQDQLESLGDTGRAGYGDLKTRRKTAGVAAKQAGRESDFDLREGLREADFDRKRAERRNRSRVAGDESAFGSRIAGIESSADARVKEVERWSKDAEKSYVEMQRARDKETKATERIAKVKEEQGRSIQKAQLETRVNAASTGGKVKVLSGALDQLMASPVPADPIEAGKRDVRIANMQARLARAQHTAGGPGLFGRANKLISDKVPMGLVFQTLFGGWEVANAAGAIQQGNINAMFAPTALGGLQARQQAMQQATGGIFSSIVKAGWNLGGDAFGFDSFKKLDRDVGEATFRDELQTGTRDMSRDAGFRSRLLGAGRGTLGADIEAINIKYEKEQQQLREKGFGGRSESDMRVKLRAYDNYQKTLAEYRQLEAKEKAKRIHVNEVADEDIGNFAAPVTELERSANRVSKARDEAPGGGTVADIRQAMRQIQENVAVSTRDKQADIAFLLRQESLKISAQSASASQMEMTARGASPLAVQRTTVEAENRLRSNEARYALEKEASKGRASYRPLDMIQDLMPGGAGGVRAMAAVKLRTTERENAARLGMVGRAEAMFGSQIGDTATAMQEGRVGAGYRAANRPVQASLADLLAAENAKVSRAKLDAKANPDLASLVGEAEADRAARVGEFRATTARNARLGTSQTMFGAMQTNMQTAGMGQGAAFMGIGFQRALAREQNPFRGYDDSLAGQFDMAADMTAGAQAGAMRKQFGLQSSGIVRQGKQFDEMLEGRPDRAEAQGIIGSLEQSLANPMLSQKDRQGLLSNAKKQLQFLNRTTGFSQADMSEFGAEADKITSRSGPNMFNGFFGGGFDGMMAGIPSTFKNGAKDGNDSAVGGATAITGGKTIANLDESIRALDKSFQAMAAKL